MSTHLETIVEEVAGIFHHLQWDQDKSLKVSPADFKFITDIAGKTSQGKQISTKQAEVAIRILQKYITVLPTRDNFPWSEEELSAAISMPIYRQPPYQSVPVRREVRYIGNRKIALRSKFSPQVTKRIRSTVDKKCIRNVIGRSRYNHNQFDFPRFNKKHRLWVIEVTEGNLEAVMRTVKKANFEFDDSVVQFLTDCANTVENETTISSVDNEIEIIVQNDEFMSLWLDDTFKEKKSV